MSEVKSEGPNIAGETIAALFVERIGYLEPTDLAPLLHEAFVFRTMFRSVGLPLTKQADRDQFLQFLIDARAIFPNLCPHRVINVISSGNHVVVESECEALFSDGRRYSNQFSFHVIFENGKIIEVREYTDFLHTFEVVFSRSVEVPDHEGQ